MASHFDDVTDTIPLPPMPTETALRSGQEGSEADEFQRDRFRLGQEIARDFEDITGSYPRYDKGDNTGGMGRSYLSDITDTGFRQLHPDIERKYGGLVAGQNFLQQTPTANSKVIQSQFSDFTMPGKDRDSGDDSYEIGRGYNGGQTNSLLHNTMDLFSMNPAAGAGNDRKAMNGRTDGQTPRTSRNQTRKQPTRTNGSPVPQAQSPPLDFSPSAVHKRGSGAKSRGSPSRAAQSSKIMDIVSSAGSSGSKNKPERRTYDEDGDDAFADEGRDRPSNAKGSRNPGHPQKISRADISTSKVRKDKEPSAFPRAFKSTPDFLKELGLEGHTTTNLQMKLDGLKDPQPRPRSVPNAAPSARRDATYSARQPEDLTELFSGNEVTRFSSKRVGFSPSHAAIESIPIPPDSRALLEAMHELQEKVATLERARSSQRNKVSKLEADLKRAELLYQQSQQVSNKTIAKDHDSTFDSTMDDDEEAEAREKARMHWMMDKLRMQSVVEQLQDGIEKASRDLDGARRALEIMEQNNHIAVKSVAAAISSREDMRAANRELETQLATLESDHQHVQVVNRQQQEQNELRVAKLKRRVKDARMVASAAEQALLESSKQNKTRTRVPQSALRNLANQDRGFHSTPIRQSDFDKLVREELMRTRPDLFGDQSTPISIPHGTESPMKSKRVQISSTNRSPRDVPIARDGLAESRGKRSGRDRGQVSDDSCASISPEEIRQIAKDLSMDRKKRKAANASSENRPMAGAEKDNNRRAVKVVYLVDKNSSKTHQKKNDEAQAAPPSLSTAANNPQPAAATFQPEGNANNASKVDSSYMRTPDHVVPSDTTTPPPPDMDHESANVNHDREQCTVCQRYDRLRRLDEIAAEDNPLARADANSSPDVDSADRTVRPSADPLEQLKSVLGQLDDEYLHLKIKYARKTKELVECQPSVELRRRKALSLEIKEIESEMGAKADQIYALHDVNREFCAQPHGGCGNLGDMTEDLIRSLNLDAGH